MIKKVRLIAVVLVMALTLSACSSSNQPTAELVLPGEGTESSGLTEKTALEDVKASDYEDTLDGLCDYMMDNYIIAGSQTEMSYDVIGASGGYMYIFTYNGSTVQVELYSFELDELSEDAEESLKSIEEDGMFIVLDTEVEADISDNGRYVMIYTDASSDDANEAQYERAVELLKNFYA